MGCCFSQTDKTTVYEVTLDANGVARRVPAGTGTHFIHVNEEYETHLEEKRYNIPIPEDNNKDMINNNNLINKPVQAHQQSRFPFLPAARMNPSTKPNSRISPLVVNDDDEKKANNPSS
ncbi:hypothetical protein BDA99DRAFT_515947 [Phascolomyces articulosus]|uniref:Uncharacterized protein n=1 Tax=Phascolomyces articulosus TaxID=60185 RepID=A0AAD5JWD0_9FUNG|nr:hypothetical protein BDA99DRAFT_515947 [Phascolomyces articulosus]